MSVNPSAWIVSRRTCIVVLALMPLLIHVPFLGGGWVTDDFMHVAHLENEGFAEVLRSPDVFGYFRPVAQATLLADYRLAGDRPWTFRLTNLVLHAAVIAVAFVLAEMLFGGIIAAFLATLAFELTPKAHPLAVQWISARPDLLMALFSMLAVIAWIRWQRSGGAGWLGTALLSYLLALLSKEPAVLLPVVLLFTPGRRAPVRRRLMGVGLMLGVAAIAFLIRLNANARIPLPDPHYDLLAPLGRDLHNARNYFLRALPAPVTLMLVTALLAAMRPVSSPAKRPPPRAISARSSCLVLHGSSPLLRRSCLSLPVASCTSISRGSGCA